MEKLIGKVIEVFIPTENNIDIMNSNKIGFKVLINNKILEIIEYQDEINTYILKKDKVVITEEIIDGKKYTNIEMYDGEDYE